MDCTKYIKMLPKEREKTCEWSGCKMVFPNDQQCFQHIKQAHDPRKMGKCLWDQCYYTSKTPNNMTNHIKKHMELVEGICDICSIKFKWKFDLKKHVKTFHAKNNVATEMQMVKFQDYFVYIAFKKQVISNSIAMLLN